MTLTKRLHRRRIAVDGYYQDLVGYWALPVAVVGQYGSARFGQWIGYAWGKVRSVVDDGSECATIIGEITARLNSLEDKEAELGALYVGDPTDNPPVAKNCGDLINWLRSIGEDEAVSVLMAASTGATRE